MKGMLGLLLLSSCAMAQSSLFLEAAAKRAKTTTDKFLEKVCDHEKDQIAKRVFWEYGSVFIAGEKVRIPRTCVFKDEESVRDFHEELKLSSARIGVAEITLQTEAMRSLLDAIDEAWAQQLRITPLDGTIAGTRDYQDTVRLWSSRFNRALDYWASRGRIRESEADAARKLEPHEQIPLVIKWEQARLWFSTGFNKSIFTSVAAPGTSQHLSGLAFDIVEHSNSRVRSLLNKHGWFQTIRSDEPHFTYLGLAEAELPGRGLEMVIHRGNFYWVPRSSPANSRLIRRVADSPSREGRQPRRQSPSYP
ncbi:MAG: D-alanyl-D-alanine carboxypeptidase family protein [bacterium]|nr:D-alanyl-D-alanine carboxypeptidase family protein [bacterium]